MSRKEWNDFKTLAPAVNAALLDVSNAIQASGLDPALVELTKFYASKLNGCAFCIHFHAIEARKREIEDDRLHLIEAWRDAAVFSERERAALLWTEALTLLEARREIDPAHYDTVRRHFCDQELAHLTTAIALVNAWNRIAKAYQFSLPARHSRSTDSVNKQRRKES